MCQRAVHIFMITSTILSLLFLTIWARSGMHGDWLTRGSDGVQYGLQSDWGYLALVRIDSPMVPDGFGWEINNGGYSSAQCGSASGVSYADVFTFVRGNYDPHWRTGLSGSYSGTYWPLSVSYVLPVAIFATPPMIWFLMGLRRRLIVRLRTRRGLCRICGY